jgi:hypothetical protein
VLAQVEIAEQIGAPRTHARPQRGEGRGPHTCTNQCD